MPDWLPVADRKRLLLHVAQLMHEQPHTVETTTAWQQWNGSTDSLATVELILNIEDELAELRR